MRRPGIFFRAVCFEKGDCFASDSNTPARLNRSGWDDRLLRRYLGVW